MTTHYSVLGVSPQASLPEIKSAHRRLCLRLHPDKQRSPSSPANADGSTQMNDGNDGSNDVREKLSQCNINNGDKSVSLSVTESDDVDQRFRQVQRAWECLRDPSRRKAYDDELASAATKCALKAEKATIVKLNEMECEYCDVEDDEKNDCGISRDGDGPKDGEGRTTKVYIWPCRCGDEFEILQEELTMVLLNDASTSDEANIFECQSCCLCIKVETFD